MEAKNEPGDGQVGNVSFQMAKMTIDGKSVKYYGYKAGTDNDFYIKNRGLFIGFGY